MKSRKPETPLEEILLDKLQFVHKIKTRLLAQVHVIETTVYEIKLCFLDVNSLIQDSS